MKRIATVFLAVIAVTSIAAAEAEVTNVVARQRWPWSPVVDIDFTVKGSNTYVKFTGQYDGVEPFALAEKYLEGDFCSELKPGLHHVTWDPVSAGFGSAEFKNFRVKVEADIDHTYLILNLTDGSFSYAAEEPVGGWTSDPAYYQTNIVFRRIKAGSATLGIDKTFYTTVFPGIKSGFSSTYNYTTPHNVTLTSDFYIGVFPVTKAQKYLAEQHLLGNTPNVSTYDAVIPDSGTSYDDLRGTTNNLDGVDSGIDWPNTKYAVREGSLISAFRSICADTFPEEWKIDLPTVVQWEYAARADTPTNQLWSVGGLVTDSGATLTNYLDRIATWKHNQSGNPNSMVGTKLPNKWGLYDMIGLCTEWNLDWQSNDPKYYRGTNPVGPTSAKYRSRRSCGKTNDLDQKTVPAFIGTNGSTSQQYFRLCIHLKSLFD